MTDEKTKILEENEIEDYNFVDSVNVENAIEILKILGQGNQALYDKMLHEDLYSREGLFFKVKLELLTSKKFEKMLAPEKKEWDCPTCGKTHEEGHICMA